MEYNMQSKEKGKKNKTGKKQNIYQVGKIKSTK